MTIEGKVIFDPQSGKAFGRLLQVLYDLGVCDVAAVHWVAADYPKDGPTILSWQAVVRWNE